MDESLLVFAVVVENISLNKAARKLNISQPALSRKISRLEASLGVELFRRKGKRLELSEAGQVAYDYALELRALHNNLSRSLNGFKEDYNRSVTLGASLTTLQSTLPDFIQIILQGAPEIDIHAITGKTHEITELVIKSKVDAGLVASSVEHQDIVCLPLFEDHLCLVLPQQQHALLKMPTVRIQDLNNLPMILFSRGTWYRVLMDELFQKYDTRPQIKMEIDSFEAILRLVATCKTATLLPVSYLRPRLLEQNDLVQVSIRELKQTTRTTSLIYRRSESLNPQVQQLLNIASSHYPLSHSHIAKVTP